MNKINKGYICEGDADLLLDLARATFDGSEQGGEGDPLRNEVDTAFTGIFRGPRTQDLLDYELDRAFSSIRGTVRDNIRGVYTLPEHDGFQKL